MVKDHTTTESARANFPGPPSKNGDTQSKHLRPYVSIIVENKVVDAFIDTGADLTFISEELRQSIDSLQKRPLQKPVGLTTSVTSEIIDKLGCVSLNLNFGSKQMCHEVQVARGIDKSFIIGWDFLLNHSVILDLHGGYMEMYGIRYPFVKPMSNTPLCSSVVAHISCSLPAKSESMLLARISTSKHSVIPDEQCGVF